MIAELRELVKRYAVDSRIDYAEFRRLFVPRFAARVDENSANQCVVEDIEEACADFSEELVDEVVLKRKLALAAGLKLETGSELVLSTVDLPAVLTSSSDSDPYWQDFGNLAPAGAGTEAPEDVFRSWAASGTCSIPNLPAPLLDALCKPPRVFYMATVNG
jgi:hypothetical protein